MMGHAVVETVVDPEATEVMAFDRDTPFRVTVGEVPCMVLV